MVRAGNGVVSKVAQRMAGIGGKRQAQLVVPIASSAAAVGNPVAKGQSVSDHGDDYDQIHIKEVIQDNNDHSELSVIKGRLLQPVNPAVTQARRLAGGAAANGAAV